MKVLIISPFATSPKATFKERILPFAVSLRILGNKVNILIPPYDNLKDSDIQYSVKRVGIINIKISRLLLINIYRMIRLILRYKPDIIYVFKTSFFSFYVLICLTLLKRFKKNLPKIVLDREDWEYDWIIIKRNSIVIAKIHRYVEKIILKNVDGITVVSSFLYRDTMNILSNEKNKNKPRIKYLPNGCILNNLYFKPTELKNYNNPKICICIYTRFWEVNVNAVLKIICGILKQRNGIAKFKIIGEGSKGQHLELQASIKNQGFSNDVCFLGWLRFEDVIKELKYSDIALFYLNESMLSMAKCSVRLIQHLICKNAVVASAIGEVPRYVINMKTGLLVKNNCVNDFVNKILSLIDNPELRLKLGNAGHKNVLEKFDICNLSVKLNKFLKELVS